jgi:hypothetical protein
MRDWGWLWVRRGVWVFPRDAASRVGFRHRAGKRPAESRKGFHGLEQTLDWPVPIQHCPNPGKIVPAATEPFLFYRVILERQVSWKRRAAEGS